MPVDNPMMDENGSVNYRLAGNDDIPEMVGLLREIMDNHGVDDPGAERMSRTLALIMGGPDHRFVVAEDPGGLVGMCGLLFHMSTWSASKACEIQDVIVAAEHRRSGLGRALVETAAEVARREGCTRLSLTAEAWNLPAHAFYRRLGFSEKTCLYFERSLVG
jgi:GNAT superfamily N-acetyltransferase